ncbi:polysaccharide deacetylase family protein [Chamaesiphon sp. VAR_69_metabat_338]|uniref:polysaccharide deacetylase family protein n=1 Tax=Chamaesiphon sp. VAR_69_metabat_338 TaxID=2964704 RepID=UPI00286DC2FC|nr:polysaccharide deacetylase family protein [Chamaesiphon sp. VAR_69_metabat_338]
MYHRVAELDIDPWSLCVTPQHFAEHLAVIKEIAHPISLQQLNRDRQQGTIPHRAVAISFDDGYADNLDLAKPILESYGIPATMFVSTGYLGAQREFWWDELARILLKPGTLPPQLTLIIGDNCCEWELDTAADYSQSAYRHDRYCRAWAAQPGSRMFLYYSIWQVLRDLAEIDRQQALAQIATWAGDDSQPRSSYLPLTVDELASLSSGELVEIGAHTVNHPFLPAQPIAVQQAEIDRSKRELERLLDRPVTSFSYPFGDRTAATIELVKASGFEYACSTQPDVVWGGSNCFDLPRYGVGNWNGAEFAERLELWLQ